MFGDRIGIVRLRQLLDRLRYSLSFVPGMYVLAAILVVQITLLIDRNTDDPWLPEMLTTTVGSARAVLGTIAGGLITSITLLLSMVLVTIQVASQQFSPRTLRDWLGDRVLQHSVGLALGTTVFSLSALRSARTLGEGESATDVTPHLSVLIALVLAVLALFGVVWSVDHISNSMRIGSVSRRIANDTIAIVRREGELRAGQRPASVPAMPSRTDDGDAGDLDVPEVPDGAVPLTSPNAGWVQQIDDQALLDELPEGASAYVTAPLGGFVPADAPLMWVLGDGELDDTTRERLVGAFATGDSRTLQQDISFGLMQLTDIAVRALSPGINDPSTANDIVVQLGNVLLSVWAIPVAQAERRQDGRTLVRHRPQHGEHLRRAYDPIRRHARADPQVLLTMLRELHTMRREIVRRDLPGPVGPIDEMVSAIAATADRSTWSERERDDFARLVDAAAG